MIRNGGLIIVEDTHTSYLKEFGNPSKSSFQNFCRKGADAIQARYPDSKSRTTAFSLAVWSISFFESITVFHINRSLCIENIGLTNSGIPLQEIRNNDFRYGSDREWLSVIKIAQKIFACEFKSIGGVRTYLHPINLLYGNSWVRRIIRVTFFPLRLLCNCIIFIELRMQFFRIRKRNMNYFSGL